MNRAEVGRRGEAVAARFYQKQGCLLVAHNYSLPVGGDRPHPAGTRRDTGFLRGKDPPAGFSDHPC